MIEVLDGLREVSLLIHGDARGADRLGGEWAKVRGVQEVKCPANWDAHGKSAGYRRNSAMLLLKPDLVVAFPGGAGTASMVRMAKNNYIEVVEIPDDIP